MNDFSQCPTDGDLGLLTLLIKSGRFAESRLDDSLASAGLTFVKWRTLDALANADSPVSLGRLAQYHSCAKSNVTQLADRLEREGIIQRVNDPRDRRSILVELTGLGRKMQQAGRRVLDTATREFFAASTEEARSALRLLLTSLPVNRSADSM